MLPCVCYSLGSAAFLAERWIHQLPRYAIFLDNFPISPRAQVTLTLAQPSGQRLLCIRSFRPQWRLPTPRTIPVCVNYSLNSEFSPESSHRSFAINLCVRSILEQSTAASDKTNTLHTIDVDVPRLLLLRHSDAFTSIRTGSQERTLCARGTSINSGAVSHYCSQ